MNLTEKWDIEIKPKKSLLDVNLKQVYDYRDLLIMFVKRDVVTLYKQTILGPIWFFVQPIMTMAIYVFVFGNIAKISTDEIPQPLFYLSGIILWNYFSECFNQTADTFSQNANIFGKVFFPRLIIPLSKVVSGLIKFVIQFILFFTLFLYYYFTTNVISPSPLLIFLPLLIIMMAGIGLGFGLIFSSLTTKYKDLKFLIQFGVQLLMYATPIIYPLSSIPADKKIWLNINPLTHIIEAFKYIFLGKGAFSEMGLIYSAVFTLIILFTGVIVFNKTEKSFMDTV